MGNPSLAGLPLFGGIQLTMGIASVTLGSLNILTSACAAILVGLGIDFAVHIYDRYHQERASGVDIASAIETTLTQTGRGIWTGAFTTIFAFGVLFFSRVQGIVELAFLFLWDCSVPFSVSILSYPLFWSGSIKGRTLILTPLFKRSGSTSFLLFSRKIRCFRSSS